MKIALNPNEMVVKAGDSSFMNNGHPVRGKLIITTQRIFFKPQSNGREYSELVIDPEDIRDVMTFNERLLFPNGLNIVTKNGTQNKFLVRKRNSWSEQIARMF